MTILKIYKLEDPEEADAISTLLEGEHIIGRGILNCNDKRVSRKHARIVIEKDGVTIRSEHVNPCFHKSSVSNSISILPKDKSIELNDNDQFALLSDNFWFRVKVIKGNESETNRSLEFSESNSNHVLGVATKRNSSELDIASPKKQKTFNLPQTSPTSPIPDVLMPSRLLANLESIVAEDFGTTLGHSVIETTHNSNKDVSDNEDSFIESVSHDPVASETIPAEVIGNLEEIRNESVEKLIENQQNTVIEQNQNTEDKSVNQIKDIKVEPQDEPSSSKIVKNECNKNTDTIQDESTSSMQNKIKKENSDCDNETMVPDNVNTSTNSLNNSTVNSTDLPNTASSPNDYHPRIRRDRCWYGQTCYRKNPQHRSDFSHPGDDDYDSDPNDDRLPCPFGASCYRTNLDHRREFKHTGRPAPKPNNPSPSSPGPAPGSSNQTTKPKKKRPQKKQQPKKKKDNSDESNAEDEDLSDASTDTPPRKKRKATQKKQKLNETPEDDYDYEDPFIDDGSGEEFEVSGSDDDDDTDWEDSQQADEASQEIRRLRREAKKFTKTKK